MTVIDGFLVVNILLSASIAWVCVCRMSVMTRHTTRALFRFRYVVIFVASLGNLSSPWFFNEVPGPGAAMLAFALLWHLAASVSQWRHGVPEDGRTCPVPFDEASR